MRLISPWCQVNIGSCRFMLGQCYLANGEGQKVSPSSQTLVTASGVLRSCPHTVASLSGSAVFPGGGDRGGEGGVSDETDGQ